ncbi:hypothetical protein BUALT_Bualt09G0032800 [Buddleja alternifolia]|uniref:Uncharacterized protein n=1 Tax=Buddleja alternifolia TaxID=168488 RepID=A0AAV6X427_9LAMI|nr:hypothetical protein BUALT_Bualt09G0032800 [Buddleja alternifolia]
MEVANTEAAAGAGEAAQEDDGVMASWLIVDDETAAELSKLLELFETPPPPMKVRFIDDPYSSPVIFQSSSAYVTINGNEESCGSSFSDADSSVMASVHLGTARGFGGAWEVEYAEARDWGMDVDLKVDGCDYDGDGDEDEAMLVEFLGEDIFGLGGRSL